MKKIPIIAFLGFIMFEASAQVINQNASPNNLTMPYHNPYDTSLNPNLCDTLNYIFISMLDSYRVQKFTRQGFIRNNDTSSQSRVKYTRLPGAQADNIITGSPFVFVCPYRYGGDSARMFGVFTSVVNTVKECLLTGPVDSLNAWYSLGSEKSRVIRYKYTVTALKPGIDPKLKNTMVEIEFNPDLSGQRTDNFITYRVNIIIRPG